MIVSSRRFDRNKIGVRFVLFVPGHTPTLVLPYIPFINPYHRGKLYLDIERMFNEEKRDDLALISPFGVVIFTRDAKTVKEAFLTKEKMRKPIKIYIPFLGLFGPNIVITEGEEWLRHRLVVQPSFSDENLRFMVQSTAHEMTKLIGKWTGMVNIVPAEDITHVTLSVICRAMFGIELSEEDEHAKRLTGMPLEEIFKTVSEDTVIRALTPNVAYFLPSQRLRKVKRAFDAFEVYGADLIARRQHQNSPRRKDLLSMLLKANSGDEDEKRRLSNREIFADIFILMFAGHETTATALTWALTLLALHPEEQAGLYNEVIEVVGKDREPTYEDLPGLIRCRAVLQEAMRMYPPVVHVPRIADVECSLNGVPFEKGQRIIVSLWGLHRNPKYWADPLKFQPDRFDPRVSSAVDDYHWATFARGPRACIGSRFSLIEGTIILAMLARRLIFSAPSYTKENIKDGYSNITLKPTPSPMLFVDPRENSE